MPKLRLPLLAAALGVGLFAQTFAPTGAMTSARVGAAAVALPNGKVLIAGGQSVYPAPVINQSGQSLASAELYDPVAGSFTATGNMSAARARPSAVALANGNALVVDGSGADIYNTAAGTFSGVALPTALSAATAVALSDGRVLVTGPQAASCGPGTCSDPVEIYDPNTGVFAASGALLVARSEFTATLLSGGQVLIAGGFDTDSLSTSPVSSSEIYNPQTGTSTAGPAMAYPVAAAAAVRLGNGQVLICGGDAMISSAISQAELYDPVQNSFVATGSMNVGRDAHRAALLADGRVLVAGGFTEGGAVQNSAEIYDPALATFAMTGAMSGARELFPAVLVQSGAVLVAGGLGAGDNYPALDEAELYQPATAPAPDFSLTTAMPIVTVTGGSSATFTVSGNGSNGFSGAIALSCQDTGAATCVFQPASITAGQSSTLTISHLSPAGGGVLQFSAQGVSGGDTHTLALEATYVPPSLTPSGLTFGSQAVGTSSAALTLTLGNGGQSAMQISAIAISGDFTETNTCPASLAPAATCTIGVVFTPTASGSRRGTLTFTDDAALSPQTAVLEGAATDISLQAAPGSNASASMQPGQSANYSIAITPLGGFTGTVNLACSGAPAGTVCTPNPASVTLSSSSAISAAINVTTAAAAAATRLADGTGLRMSMVWLGLVALALLVWPGWRRRRLSLLGAPIALALLLGGCGSNSTPAAMNNTSGTPSTPAGTYTLTVTATGAGIDRTLQLTLNVQ